MIDLATSLSFLTAPALAFINYKLVMASFFPDESRPPKWLQLLSWLGLVFLTAFAGLFFYWRFFI